MKVAVDTETTGLKWAKDEKPYAVGFYYEDGTKKYFDALVDPMTRQPLWTDETLNKIQDRLSTADEYIFANAKYDLHMLESINLKVEGQIHDVILMAKICNTLELNCGLKPLSKKYLNIPDDDEKNLKATTVSARKIGKEKGWKCGSPHYEVTQDYWLCKLINSSNNLCEIYCLKDVERTFKLFQFYSEGLRVLGRWHTYLFEMNVAERIFQIEKIGLKVNESLLNQLLLKTNTTCFQIEAQFKKAGIDNINSTQQVVKYLLSLGVPLTDRTEPSQTYPEGQLKLNNTILKRHLNFPQVEQYLIYQANATGRGYFMNYVAHMTDDKVIHPNLHQDRTKSFRLSSSDPNLQNVTSAETNDNPYSVDGRQTFCPREDYVWVSIDYEQLELRIFASRGNVTKLLNAFRTGGDPHNETRLAIPYLAAKDPKPGRKLAKNTNFTVINCGGKNVLFEKYGVPLDEGEEVISGFYLANPEARERQKSAERFAKQHGYIINAYNRQLDIDLDFAYRATSYDIQGSAADLVKRGLIRCYNFIKQNFSPEEVRILLQIHDELVFEIHKDIYDICLVRKLANLMANNDGAFSIPTPTSASLIKESWSKKEEIIL
ncbi:MAG: hypothetical protein IPM51_11640 [Sphingobacteriaceae bacterium]|nr:hypothetical protein [Sphingobacteriaceae bacterium]